MLLMRKATFSVQVSYLKMVLQNVATAANGYKSSIEMSARSKCSNGTYFETVNAAHLGDTSSVGHGKSHMVA